VLAYEPVKERAAQQQHIEIELRPNPLPGWRRGVVILACVLTLLLDGAVTATINAGLPYLQGRVAASPDEGSWLLTSFNACYYSVILLSPWLFVRVGRKRLLLISRAGYALISLLLVEVTSFPLMVALRAIQGCFQGAIYVPAALLMFFSVPVEALPIIIPSFALIILGGGTMGSLIGGYFGDTYGGGDVFFPGAIATIVIFVLLLVSAPKDGKSDRSLRFDGVGVFLSLVMFGAMQYLANEGERRNWFDSPSVIYATVIFAIAAPAFVIWEARTRFPHLNLTLFTRFHNLSVGACVNVVAGILGFSITSFVLYLQALLAATPELAGEMILLRLVTYFVGVPTAYLLVAKKILDVRVVLSLAAIGVTISYFGFAQTMTTTADAAAFIAITLIFAFFFACLSQPTPSLVIGVLPPQLLLSGLSIYKISAPIGLMLAGMLMPTILDHSSAHHASDLAGYVALHSAGVAKYLNAGGSLHALNSQLQSQALTWAYADTMRVFGLITLLVIPIVLFLRIPRLRPRIGERLQQAERKAEPVEVGA
jgi:MFS transporter, DHA2 family, multidrug resistance protein